MTTRIMIEGGIARLIDTRILAEMPLAALAPHMVKAIPTITPLLPDDCRLIAYDPDSKRGMLVVQVDPYVHTMNMIFDTQRNVPATDLARKDRNNRATWHLSCPYLLFVYGFNFDTTAANREGREVMGQDIQFTITDVHMYWRPAPLRSLTDGLWRVKMPNIYGDARICWGNTTADTTSLAARIDDQVKNFFVQGFSDHLGITFPVADVDSLTDWEAKSQANPLFWTTWGEWNVPATTTFGQLTTGLGMPAVGEPPTAILDLPEPPLYFGLGRAREWAQTLNPQTRRVMMAVIAETMAEPEAPPAATIHGEPEPPARRPRETLAQRRARLAAEADATAVATAIATDTQIPDAPNA